MQLFKCILPPVELPRDTLARRRTPRFAVNPEFSLQARVAAVCRGEHGEPMGNERAGRLWKGRLVDCSEDGARIRFPGGVYAGPGDAGARRASEARTAELHRLFRWVVSNLAPIVPQVVRKFLRHCAKS